MFAAAEPFWRGALTSDFGELVRAAGFKDVQTGYQDAVSKAVPGAGGFGRFINDGWRGPK